MHERRVVLERVVAERDQRLCRRPALRAQPGRVVDVEQRSKAFAFLTRDELPGDHHVEGGVAGAGAAPVEHRRRAAPPGRARCARRGRSGPRPAARPTAAPAGPLPPLERSRCVDPRERVPHVRLELRERPAAPAAGLRRTAGVDRLQRPDERRRPRRPEASRREARLEPRVHRPEPGVARAGAPVRDQRAGSRPAAGRRAQRESAPLGRPAPRARRGAAGAARARRRGDR